MWAPIAVAQSRARRLELGEDRSWLTVMGVLAAVEFLWWAVCWDAGFAPAPYVGTYSVIAGAALAAALATRAVVRRRAGRAAWSVLLLGTILIVIGASLFLPLKYAIPGQVPFWLDEPLAAAERQLLGTDAWVIADRLFGWALVPVDRLYGLWLPVQSLVLFWVMAEPPSRAKSRALIAYALAWFVLGIAAATLFASAGPIFYDRLLGGSGFGALSDTLRSGGAWMVRAEADAMWASLASGQPSLVAGISALPSIHVAVSLWIYLAARALAPRAAPVALAYAVFIFIASVQLGWHYVTDGVAGALGMGAMWWLAARLEGVIGGKATARA